MLPPACMEPSAPTRWTSNLDNPTGEEGSSKLPVRTHAGAREFRGLGTLPTELFRYTRCLGGCSRIPQGTIPGHLTMGVAFFVGRRTAFDQQRGAGWYDNSQRNDGGPVRWRARADAGVWRWRRRWRATGFAGAGRHADGRARRGAAGRGGGRSGQGGGRSRPGDC